MTKNKNAGGLVQNTIFLLVGQILVKGLQFLMIPFFTRWLSPEEFGTFDLLSTYISLLLPVVSLSIMEAVFRFSVDEYSEPEKNIAVASIFLFGQFGCFSIILTVWGTMKNNSLWFPFWCLFGAQLITTYLQGCVRALKRLSLYAISNVLTTIGIAVFTTCFVFVFRMGVRGMLYGYAMGYVCGDIFLLVNLKLKLSWLSFSGKFSLIKKLLNYSSPLILNDISWWVLNVSDRQIINLFLGDIHNGIYAVSSKIPSLCTAVFGVFGMSWQQEVAERINDSDRETYFNKILNNLLRTILSICILLLAFDFLLFNLLLGEEYREGRKYVAILLFASVFSSVMLFLGAIQIGLKRPKENGITTVIGAVINIIVDLSLINTIHLYAAALSTLVANAFTAFLRWYRLKSEFKFYIEKETIIAVFLFMYMSVMDMDIQLPFFVQIVNTILGIVIFVILNREMLKKCVNKLLK